MRSLLMIMPLALGACAPAPPPPPGEIPHHGASAYVCRGESLGQFAGRPATQELGADMLRVSGARRIRWVAHGMMVTMDFSPERLTVQLTPDNRVERASCG
jgi:hypothetical protein